MTPSISNWVQGWFHLEPISPPRTPLFQSCLHPIFSPFLLKKKKKNLPDIPSLSAYRVFVYRDAYAAVGLIVCSCRRRLVSPARAAAPAWRALRKTSRAAEGAAWIAVSCVSDAVGDNADSRRPLGGVCEESSPRGTEGVSSVGKVTFGSLKLSSASFLAVPTLSEPAITAGDGLQMSG